jgi:transposase
MRKCTQYSKEFKEKMLAKVLSPNAPSAIELAKESGVPYATLYHWIVKSRNNKSIVGEGSPMRPKDRTAETKLQAVFDTLHMTKEERGAYCRKKGLYTHHLDEWKEQILSGLNSVDSKVHKSEYRELMVNNKQLKTDLRRKEKALAEASALLILKKKASLIWGDGEDD